MKSKTKRIIIIVLLILIGIAAVCGYFAYNIFFANNTNIAKSEYLYIPSGATFDDMLDSLNSNNFLMQESSFKRAAKIMKFTKVRSGRYKIKSGMSNKTLVSMLRSGRQEPVNITFAGNIRSKEKIASIAAKYIEADSISILNTLNDNLLLQNFGFDNENILGMFIPNTYQFYWNTSAVRFLERMHKEFDKFWNDERKAKLKETGYAQLEAITLASIVAEETNAVKEMPTIAGVYINRLKTNMPLQADPTLKFAIGDFAIRRVLNIHKEYESPYNTYKYTGLPPAPICVPPITAIDAVLNYEQHDYYYFCAKDDFSGYHTFAKTLDQHNLNAAAYHRALNKRGIK